MGEMPLPITRQSCRSTQLQMMTGLCGQVGNQRLAALGYSNKSYDVNTVVSGGPRTKENNVNYEAMFTIEKIKFNMIAVERSVIMWIVKRLIAMADTRLRGMQQCVANMDKILQEVRSL